MSLAQQLSVLLCEEADEGVEAVRHAVEDHVTQHPFSPLADLANEILTNEDALKDDVAFKSNDTVVVLYATSGAVVGSDTTSLSGANHQSPPRTAASPGRGFNNATSALTSLNLTDSYGKSKLGVLTEATREEHDTLVQMNRPMRYVLLFNTKMEGRATTTKSGLAIVKHDAQPERVNTSGKRGMAIVTRTSAPLQRARDIVASLERGGSKADVDAALTDCCNWLYESVVLIEEEFEQAINPPSNNSEDVSSTSAFSLVDAVSRKFLALAMLKDFVLGPSNTFQQLETLIAPSSAAKQRWSQRKSHLTVTYNTARMEARWMQLLSTPLLTLKLTNTARAQSLDALKKIVEQLSSALTLIFCAAPSGLETDALLGGGGAAASSLNGDAASISARLNSLNSTSVQASAIIESQMQQQAASFIQSHLLHYLRTYVIPAIGSDLLGKVEDLLDLPRSLSIERDDLLHYYKKDHDHNDSNDEQQGDEEKKGNPPVDGVAGGYMLPVVTKPAKMNHLKESSELLRLWTSNVERLSTFMVPDAAINAEKKNLKLLQFDPRRSLALQLNELGGDLGDQLTPTSQRWSDLSESIILSHVRYASDRCLEVADHLRQIDEAGHGGNVSPWIRTLYKTLHRAGCHFPLLRSSQYRNWQTYTAAFEKCLALKFEVVESVEYSLARPMTDDATPAESSIAGGSSVEGGAPPVLVDDATLLRQRVRSAGRRRPDSAARHNGGLAVNNNRTTANASVMSLGSVNVSLISRAEQPAAAVGQHQVVPTSDSMVNMTNNDGTTGGMEVAMLHEERAILSSRVTVLSEELVECRALLAAMEVQLTKSQKSMAASEELNVVLMSELRALKASQYSGNNFTPSAASADDNRSPPAAPSSTTTLLAPNRELLDDVDDDTDSSVSSADTYTSSDDDLIQEHEFDLKRLPPLHSDEEEGEEVIQLKERVAIRLGEREIRRRQRLESVTAKGFNRLEKREEVHSANIKKRRIGRLAAATRQRQKLEKREEKRRVVLLKAYQRKIAQIFKLMDRFVYHAPAIVEMVPSPTPAASPERSSPQKVEEEPESPVMTAEERERERELLIRELVAQTMAIAEEVGAGSPGSPAAGVAPNSNAAASQDGSSVRGDH